MKRSWWPWLAMAAVMAVVLFIGATGTRPAATASEQVGEIAASIRCPTCSGESVAASDADISKEIRLDIAQRLQRGETEDQILGFYADRYGDGILLTPSSSGAASLIWVLPVAGLVLAASGLVIVFRRWSRVSPAHASAADRELVERAMHEGSDRGDG